jgi:phosphoribosylglycinamide formyltransferase-1
MRPINVMVLVSGGGTNLQALLNAEQYGELGPGRLAVVVSDRPETIVTEKAKLLNIPVYVEEPSPGLNKTQRRRELSDRICRIAINSNVRLIVLAGFLSILSGKILKNYSGRIINLHPSLLPKYGGEGMYGECVHKAVLDSGDRFTGCTVHIVDEGIDTGPIILQRRIPVKRGDTPDSLADRVHEEEHLAIVKAVRLMSEHIQKQIKFNMEMQQDPRKAANLTTS